MPNASRRCSECGELVEGRALTCGPRCRSRRSRRIKVARSQGGRGGGNRPENEVYDAEQHEIMVAVTQKVLEPYARDQLSDDVIKAIGGIMQLAPAALVVLEQDLTHHDPQIRHKAAALIMRYTMPEKFLPADVGGDNKITVDLSGFEQEPPAVPGDAQEMVQCDVCGEEKATDQFVGSSTRCFACYHTLREQATAGLTG